MAQRYYKVNIDMDDPEAMNSVRGGDDLAGLRVSANIHGDPIKQFPKVSFRMSGRKATDCLRNRSMWPLFSSRLKGNIEEAGLTGCEFHPVTVTHVKGVDLGQYWYFNVLKIKGALDLNESRCQWIGQGETRRLLVFRHVLIGSAVGERDFVRLEEDLPPMFASQRFVELYQANDCTGLTFREVPVT